MDEEMMPNEELDEEFETDGEATEQADAEFTDNGAEETNAADSSSTDSEDANAADDSETAKTGQDALQAQKRREREAREAQIRKQIEEDAYRKGIIDAVGNKNPYTGEAITDKSDIEEYFTMRELEKEGKDPIADYPKALRAQRQAKAEAAQKEAQRVKEVSEFAENYPDVDLATLLSDPAFGKFAGKRVEHESLSDVYRDYLSFVGEVKADTEKKAQVKARQAAAKAKSTPGSLTGNGGSSPIRTYADMSDEEFEQEIAKAKAGALKKS
ncbi:MAG: hypothetical protein IJX30_00585 [Clostridia bacterium]|nr:hypothetical protein [Clostridia bacterium]MBQ8428583.1 hypothetical protein [Clostridia bacterium]